MKDGTEGHPKYNILFIESGASAGGSFESLYQHLCVINRERFRPVVVYLNETHYLDKVKDLGISSYLLNDWRYSHRIPVFIRSAIKLMGVGIRKMLPIFYLRFARLVHRPLVKKLETITHEEKIDLIHLNDQINVDLFGLFVAERTGVVCISHLRSIQTWRSTKFGHQEAAYANLIVSAYIANSQHTKCFWEKMGLDPDKIWVVHNATPKLGVKPLNIRHIWHLDEDTNFIIGCVANLIKEKGHKFLLRAFSQFLQNYPTSVLLLVGDGPLKHDLTTEVRDLKIESQVIFTGYQKNAKEIIANLDLLVLPSRGESFGRVLLEAMQLKIPIVATNSGGIPEVIQHEHNGLLVDYDDDVALYQAMERLLIDQSLRSTVINYGSRIVREKFSIEYYATEIGQIYENVLTEKAR